MKKLMFMFMFLVCFFLVGCGSKIDIEETNEDKHVEGVEASLKITSNSEQLDEGHFQATILNETNETFTGSITFYHSSFKFWTEEINLPPGKELLNELKTKYIKHPKEGYRYEVKGDFSDKSFKAEEDYKSYTTDSDRALNVQMETIDRQSVESVLKELHSLYGDGLVHVGFFDSTQNLKDGEDPTSFPKAEFYGTLVSKTVTIYGEGGDEKFELEGY